MATTALAQPQVPRSQVPRAPVTVGPHVPLTPPDREQMIMERVKNMPPREVVELLVESFNHIDFLSASSIVAGADSNSQELVAFQEFARVLPSRTFWQLTYDREQVPAVPEGAEETTVTVEIGTSSDGMGMSVKREEKVMLRREATAWGRVWRVVPDKPEAVLPTGHWASPDVGIVRHMATYLAYPGQTQMWLGMRESMSQVKQLGLGLLQYAQDWDEKFPPDVATFKEKIMPYVGSESLFTAPGAERGTQSYNLNPGLAGKSLAQIEAPAQTVAIYLGRNEQLDFRFDGKSIVGFADGHVEAVDAERAKTLR